MAWTRALFLVALASLVSTAPAVADDEAPEADDEAPEADDAPAAAAPAEEDLEVWQTTSVRFGGIPAVNYNSDDGFGFGAVGGLYWYNGETRPYKSMIQLQLFMTTNLVHYHRFRWDFLELAGGPLRISGRVQFEASRAENYCGAGGDVVCAAEEAEQALEGLDFEDDAAYDTAARRYYLNRYVMPYGTLAARWRFRDMPHRFEVFGTWRGAYYFSGDFDEAGPYVPSRYERDVAAAGENSPLFRDGFLNVVNVGAMLDNRDNEASPIRGYWVEASARVGFGDWTYVGANAILRGYMPIGTERIVWANRLIADGIVGDVSIQELVWVGGASVQTLGGGGTAGRGVRGNRYRGRWKMLATSEFRFLILPLRFGPTKLDIGLVTFVDLGNTSLDWADFGTDPLWYGFGGGLRVALDENFIVRIDAGFSHLEDFSPKIYIDLNNVF